MFWKVFIIVVQFSAKNILFFFRKNQQLSQTPFYVSGRILRGNFLLSTFVTFSNFEHRFFCLPAKTYEQWFQSCILRSHRSILMGFLEKKPLFWIIFGPWAETLQPSGKIFLAELTKLFSTCPYKQLKEKPDSQKFFISIIFGRWAISFSIWQRFLGSIVKTTFYTSIEKFREEILYWQTVFFFFGPRAKNSRPYGKTFQQGCRNSFIRVHSNILRSNVFLNFFLSFPDDERTIFAFSRFFPTGLSELHYTCPPVKIELKLCSFEGNAFFHLFRTLSKNFLACWQNFFGWFIKTAFYVSIGTLWGEKLLFW